jgi:YesN/AraC family two-component response regulator
MKKPSFEHVLIEDDSSIKVKTYTRKNLNVPLHYHPEHEIVFILNGYGKLMVSDAMTSFGEGDLIFIGGSVPHLFIDDDEKKKKAQNKIRIVVIQFKQNLFEQVKNLPEFYRTNQLLSKIQHGVVVQRTGIWDKLIVGLNHTQGIEKFNKLSYLLDSIVKKGSYRLITRPFEQAANNGISSQRIQDIYTHLVKNYASDITVEEAAQAVHLCKSSFCRFLKKETKKTFSEHLNEIRIHFACKLLRETSYTILQIGYEVGFNNLSYFYRQFNKLKSVSPVEYRQKNQVHS